MPNIRHRLVRLALVAAALLGSSPALAGQGRSIVGVGTHKLDEQSLSRLEVLGVRHARVTIYWDQWESDPGLARRVAADVDRALDRGMELLVVVHGQPRRFTYANRNAAFEAYAAFMSRLARRFPRVAAWQLWNEMDVESFTDLFGARDQVPMRMRGRIYGSMLAKAYPAIKRANPDALVVTGGLASAPEQGFLEGLLSSGAPFDVLAIHTYGFPVRLAVELKAEAVRAILRRHERAATPLWVTEFGLQQEVVAPGFDRSRRAVDGYHLEAWRDPVLWNDRNRVFQRMYGHVLVEGGDLSYDLVRRDGSLRPAAVWLRGYLR